MLRTHLSQLADPPRHKPVADLDAAVARLLAFTPKLPPALARRLAERCTEPHPSGGLAWAWDPLHRTRAPLAYDADRHVEILRRIECEVLTVLGQRSWYPSIPGLGRREQAIPRLERLTLDAGHAVHIDTATEVAAAIAERWRRASEAPA